MPLWCRHMSVFLLCTDCAGKRALPGPGVFPEISPQFSHLSFSFEHCCFSRVRRSCFLDVLSTLSTGLSTIGPLWAVNSLNEKRRFFEAVV